MLKSPPVGCGVFRFVFSRHTKPEEKEGRVAPFIRCKVSEQVNDVVRSQVIYVNAAFISHAEYEEKDGVLRIIYTAPDHSNGWRLATLFGKEAADALEILKRL